MKSSLCIAALALASSVACVLDREEPQTDEVLGEVVSSPIVGGTAASAYSEAALIDMNGTICSGSVIAPKVVLTAGHCVVDSTSFSVVAPYASPKQSAKGVSTWTEYVQTGDYVNASKVDVAVIVLDREIALATYPKLAQAPVPAGTKVVNVGRIDDGSASFSKLFYGKQVTVKPGSSYGFPYSYVTEEIIQPGDSGGPVYLAGAAVPRTIVAVNSGGGGGTQVLGRVDLVYSKIQDIIAQTSKAAAPAPAPSTTCKGTPETEPNDDSNSPDALDGTACGALASGGDIDWYAWSVASSGVAYQLALDASGDADILMWKSTGSSWSRVQSSSPTKIAATSSSAGKYLVAVRSAGGKAQAYSLKLTR